MPMEITKPIETNASVDIKRNQESEIGQCTLIKISTDKDSKIAIRIVRDSFFVIKYVNPEIKVIVIA